MEEELILRFHGTGNAWPVPLGEEHPFYSRYSYSELANAAYSLIRRDANDIQSELVIDAGHGTIQSMLSSTNRLPEAVCLTHGHLDHTLSLDWIAQSYYRKNEKQKKLPLYCTRLVFDTVCSTYPHLKDLLDFHELKYGVAMYIEACKCNLTAFPVYHGPFAEGAAALLIDTSVKKVLFTGDLLAPLFTRKTYGYLQDLNMLVVDSNNRFPYPGSNHWSITASSPAGKEYFLRKFMNELSFTKVQLPHKQEYFDPVNHEYFAILKEEIRIEDLAFSIGDFLYEVRSDHIALVHYSGSEDERYHDDKKLSKKELKNWTVEYFSEKVIDGKVLVPAAGEELII